MSEKLKSANICTTLEELITSKPVRKYLSIVNKKMDNLLVIRSYNKDKYSNFEDNVNSDIFTKKYDIKQLTSTLKNIGEYNFSNIKEDDLFNLRDFLYKYKSIYQYDFKHFSQLIKIKGNMNVENFQKGFKEFNELFYIDGNSESTLRGILYELQCRIKLIEYIKKNNLEKDNEEIEFLFGFFEKEQLIFNYTETFEKLKNYPNEIQKIIEGQIKNNINNFRGVGGLYKEENNGYNINYYGLENKKRVKIGSIYTGGECIINDFHKDNNSIEDMIDGFNKIYSLNKDGENYEMNKIYERIINLYKAEDKIFSNEEMELIKEYINKIELLEDKNKITFHRKQKILNLKIELYYEFIHLGVIRGE